MGGLETTSELTDKRSNGLYVTEELSSESSLCGGIYLKGGREGERKKRVSSSSLLFYKEKEYLLLFL